LAGFEDKPLTPSEAGICLNSADQYVSRFQCGLRLSLFY